MFNEVIGWYLNNTVGANFDTIRFEVTIGAGSTASPTKVSRAIADAFDGASKKARLNGSENFFITSIYSLTEPGKTYCTILPDNNSTKQLQLLLFKPRLIEMKPIKLLEVDVSIDFYNTENQSNDITLILEGFWITESNTAIFNDLASRFYTILEDLDSQTLKGNQLLSLIAKSIGITNQLFINPKSYTSQSLALATPPPISISLPEEKERTKMICGTGQSPQKEDEEED